MKSAALCFLLLAVPASSWVTTSVISTRLTTRLGSSSTSNDIASLGLTPELTKLTTAFQSIGDDKLRYKQLLYMANQLAPMDESLKTPQHVVPGCLSTVHVFATLNPNDQTISFQGDSDGLLTKGLVALLVRGLSGNSADDIQTVDPKFIELAGISASLTPGRNNGFLNMLRVMKQQAKALQESAASQGDSAADAASDLENDDGTKYSAMVRILTKELQPTKLELIDNSHQHAGHAGNDMDGESHFDLYICSDKFEGLNLVKRHKLVYSTLGDIMPRIHALQIRAQTPSEAAK